MKKLLLSFLFLWLLLFPIKGVYAHLALDHVIREESNPTGLIFLVINYKDLDDIGILFENSSRVLGYFEDIDGGEPFFLTLVTSEQKRTIHNLDYKTKEIDINTNLSRYELLYHHAPDQSSKLEGFVELILPLSPHYTLIRFFPGKEFDAHSIPNAVEFGPVSFLEGISPPPIQTITPSKSPSVPIKNQSSRIVIAAAIILLLVVVLATFVGFIIYKRRQRRKVEEIPLPPPTSV